MASYLNFVFLVAVLVLASVAGSTASEHTPSPASAPSSCAAKTLYPYPKQYVTYKLDPAEGGIEIDGRINEAAWANVAWTDDFVDIMTTVVPRFATKAKMRYDDKYLYVAAYLEEPMAFANMTKNNTVIFNDNDFEVFIDPNGANFFYKEWEMNAINRYWTLCLDKPYLNGGYENSTRVFGKHGFDEPDTLHATYLDGKINDPAIGSKFWTVEIAFPLATVAYNQTGVSLPPKPGTYWRINFSRVEYRIKVEDGHYVKENPHNPDNWVWSSMGIVDMHLPERWGYIQFSEDSPIGNATTAVKDPQWTVRSIAMRVYDAELAYWNKHKTYTSNVTALVPFATPGTLDGSCALVSSIRLNGHNEYTAIIEGLDHDHVAVVRNDRYLAVMDLPTYPPR